MHGHGGGIPGILAVSKLIIYLAFSMAFPLSAVHIVQTGSGQGETPPPILVISPELPLLSSHRNQTFLCQFHAATKPEPSFKRHKVGDCHTPRYITLMLTITYLISSKNLSVFIHLISLWHFLLDWYAHDQKSRHRRVFLYGDSITSLKVYGIWSPRSVMYPGRCFKSFFMKKESMGER